MQDVFEKIIEKLEDLEVHFDNDYFSSNREAMVIKKDAIEIVKQAAEEYKDRLVSAEAYKQVAWERDIAIEQLHELGFELGEDVSNNGWIPCSERLPELETEVLIYTEQGGMTIASLTKPDIFWEDEEGNILIGVIAWHTLPLPYQPKGE